MQTACRRAETSQLWSWCLYSGDYSVFDGSGDGHDDDDNDNGRYPPPFQLTARRVSIAVLFLWMT